MDLSFAFGGDNNVSYEQLQERRKIANAIMAAQASGRAPQNLGEGINAIGTAIAGALNDRGLSAQEKAARDAASADSLAINNGATPAVPSNSIASTGSTTGSTGSTGRSAAYNGSDPATQGLDPYQSSLLNAIAGPESAGKYNIRYTPNGGVTFNDFSRHPAVPEAIPGSDQTSTAAGRYQFVKSTWDALPADVRGDGTFSPQNQDRAALYQAGMDYNDRTGQDLRADLQKNGLTPQILKALGPTWAGLKDNPGKAMAAYNGTMARNDATQDAQQDAELEGGSTVPSAAYVQALPPGQTLLPNGHIQQADPRLAVEAAMLKRQQAQQAQQQPVQVAALPPQGQTATDASPEQMQPPMPPPAPPQAQQAQQPQIDPSIPLPPQIDRTDPNNPQVVPPGAMPPDPATVARVAQALPPQQQQPPVVPPGVQRVAAAMPQVPADQPPQVPAAVQQVAQAVQGQQTPQMPPQQQGLPPAPPGISDAQVAAAQRVLSNPYASRGQQAQAQALLQRKLALDSRDPVQVELQRQQLIAAQNQNSNFATDAEIKRQQLIEAQNRNNNAPIDTAQKYKDLSKSNDPEEVQRYQYAVSRGYTGSFTDFMSIKTQRQFQTVQIQDGNGNTHTMIYDPQSNTLKTPQQFGDTTPTAPSNPYSAGGKQNEKQGDAIGFADRMVNSHNQITNLEGVGTDGIGTMLSKAPVVGNYLASSDRQQLTQSQRDFVNALLRKESGAAISQSEFENAQRQYFPQPGDQPAVIAQKRANREQAIQGVMATAGPNYKPPATFHPQYAPGEVPTTAPRQSGATTPQALPRQTEQKGITKQQYDALSSGSQYTAPDGTIRVKP